MLGHVLSDIEQSFILSGMSHIKTRAQFHRVGIYLVLICPFLAIPSIAYPNSAQAADCVNSACIDVYTLNGQLVIEAHKGNGPSASPTARKKKVVTVPKPTVKAIPKPTVKSTIVSTPKPAPRAPIVHKTIVKKVIPTLAPGVSLSDKLTKLLPTASISKQPSSNILANVAVIYWCNLPAVFTTKVAIIGEVIDVAMRASFVWSFGDGGFFVTTTPGGPYPSQEIMHTYTQPGTYLVTMVATWGGTWTHNGVARAITGQVRKLSVKTVHVVSAPTVVSG